jgi:uroporphyrinogen decarboxylase
VDDLRSGGGFVFAAVHNIQPNVPAENILAMWAAFKEANGA